MSVQLEFADLCKEVLLSVGIYSQCPHTHTHTSLGYIRQHAERSYLIYQPQMAAVNERCLLQTISCAVPGNACRAGAKTYKINSHGEINLKDTLQLPPAA